MLFYIKFLLRYLQAFLNWLAACFIFYRSRCVAMLVKSVYVCKWLCGTALWMVIKCVLEVGGGGMGWAFCLWTIDETECLDVFYLIVHAHMSVRKYLCWMVLCAVLLFVYILLYNLLYFTKPGRIPIILLCVSEMAIKLLN